MEARALTGARSLCGCRMLDEIRGDPGEPGEAEARTKLAHTLQRRWGCPRAGHTPLATLPPDLADEARCHAETIGLVPLRVRGETPPPLPATHCTCPFAQQLSPWARDIARVMRVTGKLQGAMPVASVLGREPHVWDVAAIDAVILAQGAVSDSNDAIRRREDAAKNSR